MLVEDLPSLVLNGFYIVLSLSKLKSSGLGVENGVYFSLMSFTFSTLMLGRKTGLPGQKKELKLKKRNLEAVMKEHDISLRSAGADAGGDAASIHGERGRVSLDMTLNSLRNIGDNAVPVGGGAARGGGAASGEGDLGDLELTAAGLPGSVEVDDEEGTGDLEMARVETRPVVLPGAVGGVEEDGDEGGGGEGGSGGSLSMQLEQALRREKALRAKAYEADEMRKRAAAEAVRADKADERAAIEAKRAVVEAELRQKAEMEISVLRRRVQGGEDGERGGE
jgi:hypothetical protein